jgi:hypothetical protein
VLESPEQHANVHQFSKIQLIHYLLPARQKNEHQQSTLLNYTPRLQELLDYAETEHLNEGCDFISRFNHAIFICRERSLENWTR